MITRPSLKDASQAAVAFLDFAKRLGRGERVDPSSFDDFSEYFGDSAFHASVKAVLMLGPSAPEPVPMQPAERLNPPKWKIHKNKDGEKTHWTATYHGIALRIEKRRGVDGKVIFTAMINGEDQFSRKVQSAAKSELDALAMQRVREEKRGR